MSGLEEKLIAVMCFWIPNHSVHRTRSFSIGMLWMISHIFCLVYGLHGIRCSFQEADTCMLYPLVEVVVDMLCVPSLWLLLGRVCIVLIRIMYVSVSRCLSLFAAAISACVLCVCSS